MFWLKTIIQSGKGWLNIGGVRSNDWFNHHLKMNKNRFYCIKTA